MTYSDYESEILRRSKSVLKKAPHWASALGVIYSVGNYLIPPRGKVSRVHIVLPVSLHRNKVFIYVGGYSRSAPGLQVRKYSDYKQFTRKALQWVKGITYISAYRNLMLTAPTFEEALVFWKDILFRLNVGLLEDAVNFVMPGVLDSDIIVSGSTYNVSEFKRTREVNNMLLDILRMVKYGVWYAESAFFDHGFSRSDLERFVVMGRLSVWVALGATYYTIVVPDLPELQIHPMPSVSVPMIVFKDASTNYDVSTDVTVVPFDILTALTTLKLVKDRVVSNVTRSGAEFGYSVVKEPIQLLGNFSPGEEVDFEGA
jgi:hypothetical protein